MVVHRNFKKIAILPSLVKVALCRSDLHIGIGQVAWFCLAGWSWVVLIASRVPAYSLEQLWEERSGACGYALTLLALFVQSLNGLCIVWLGMCISDLAYKP